MKTLVQRSMTLLILARALVVIGPVVASVGLGLADQRA